MKTACKLVVALVACLGTLLGAQTIVLRQDFEDTEWFKTAPAEQPAQVGDASSVGGRWIGFNGQDYRIVEGADPDAGGEQLLQVSRTNPAVYLTGTFGDENYNPPPNWDYTFKMRYRPGSVGQCKFGFRLRNTFLDADVARIQLIDNDVMGSVLDDGDGPRSEFLGRYLPEQWQTLVVTVHPYSNKLDAYVIKPDGSRAQCAAPPMQNNLPFNQVLFFNIPNYPEPALIDTVEISYGRGYTIPDEVTDIPSQAYYSRVDLYSVHIGDGVTTIGTEAFYNCMHIGNLYIGKSVETIGLRAFRSCSALTSLVLPDSVTTIRDRAFYECANLATVTFGDGVATIGKEAFYNCPKLQEVILPATVASIGENAFPEQTAVKLRLVLKPGWNLVSLNYPLAPEDQAKFDALNPIALRQGVYQRTAVSELEPGEGFWLYHPGDQDTALVFDYVAGGDAPAPRTAVPPALVGLCQGNWIWQSPEAAAGQPLYRWDGKGFQRVASEEDKQPYQGYLYP